MPVSLKEQLLFLKQQAKQALASAVASEDISIRDQAINKAADDEVLTPLEIQTVARISRTRYYQITRPHTNV